MAELKDSGARREFESGAIRDIQEGKGRCDLLPLIEVGEFMEDDIIRYIGMFRKYGQLVHIYHAIQMFTGNDEHEMANSMLELAIHYEDGARKYSDRNWENGLPVHCFVDSGVRHYLKWIRGDRDEPHNRAFLWNMFGLIWTMQNHPELDDFTIKNGI